MRAMYQDSKPCCRPVLWQGEKAGLLPELSGVLVRNASDQNPEEDQTGYTSCGRENSSTVFGYNGSVSWVLFISVQAWTVTG